LEPSKRHAFYGGELIELQVQAQFLGKIGEKKHIKFIALPFYFDPPWGRSSLGILLMKSG